MARKPNNEYMPDFSDKKPLHDKKHVYLNPANESGSSPLLISSHVVDWTQKYAKMVGDAVDLSKYPGVVIDWQKEYDGDDVIWVPENRWTHEVTNQPVKISEDVYAVYLDADAYIKKLIKQYEDPNTGEFVSDGYVDFVTRTLYRYINEVDGPPDLDNSEFIPQKYEFILRWLPKFPCKIHYWSEEDIEKNTNIVIDRGVADCTREDVLNISIPFRVKRSISKAFAYIKHDSLVYYIRIEKV